MKQNLRTEIFLISILVVVNLSIGIATFADYGESWDEARLYMYGDQSINAYQALFNKEIHVDFGDDDLRYYGPAYFMGMSLPISRVHSLFPQTPEIDLSYYLVLTTRYDMDLKIFPEIAPFYSVEQNGATLSVLKYITPKG